MAIEILLIQGWSLGSVYALVGFGFVATYKTNKVLNFTLPFLGAAGTLILSSLVSDGGFGVRRLRGKNPLTLIADHPVGWVLCFVVALALVGALGALVERLVIRPLPGRSPFILTMATLAGALVLEVLVGHAPISRRLAMPWGTSSIAIAGADVSVSTLAVCVMAPAVLLGVARFNRTWFGIAARAMADDEEAAVSIGIDRSRVMATGWALAAGLGMLAAMAFAVPPLGAGVFTTRSMPDLFFRAIPVLAIGGWDSYGGVYAAGIAIGMMQVMVGGVWGEYASFLGGGYTTILPYMVMLIVLMIRPTGVFGQAAVHRA